MKLFNQFSILLSVLFIIGFAACEKNEEKSTTNLKVRLTDNPYNATAVNVDIQSVVVNTSDDPDNWVALNTRAGVYNLLNLQNGIDTLLAAGIIPTGTLGEVRFILGAANSIEINNVIYPLTIPSGSESGLKLKVNKRLAASVDSILIDFDAALSILQTGAGDYKLKPVLKIK